MFCPNCGKDCKDAKFCPECGTKLPQTVKTDAPWQPGMACPHCSGTKLDGNSCSFCGAQLIVDPVSAESKEEDSYDIPYGWYRDGTSPGAILAKDFIAIHSKQLFQKEEVFEVPYDQLLEVKYERKPNGLGYLRFCWNNNGTKKWAYLGFFITDGRWSRARERFFHLFAVIKFMSPASTIFTLDIPENNREDIDFDDYFRRFAPYRKRAITALCNEHALTWEVAEAMVHTEFEIRQMKLYAEESILAVRDLNCVLAEGERMRKEDKEERERRALARARRR